MLIHALVIASLNASVALMILPLIHRWDSQTEPGVDPLPEPPMPDPSTIGDLITADEFAFADQATKTDVAAKADADLAAANTTLSTSDAALAAGLASVGPSFTIDTNGVVTVYLSDNSPKGFHSFKPSPVGTPLPGVTPSPTPAPAPAPAPDAPPPS